MDRLGDPHQLDREPAERVAAPEELAAAVVFLASSQSSFVHGAEFVVDGGELAA